MTVYNINLGIGWASSGVEYAQAYRAQLLRNIHQPAKFVFMDMILADNIQHLTENIGFKNDEIIWLYSHFTDIKIAPTTYTIDQVLAGFAGKPTREEVDGKIKRFFYEDQDNFLTCYLREENSPYVERCEYVSRGILVRKDYFSYTRYCTEYFIPKNNQANLIERRFYNEDGTVAYSMQGCFRPMTEEEKIAVDKMESERAEEAFRKATKQTLSQRIKKWWKNRKYK